MQRKEELRSSGSDTPLSADLRCLQGGGGGAEREAALTSLEKQLICPICLEMFTKPVVILPCQHNLCRRCANQLYQPSLFQARTTMTVNSGRFRCPSCRHEVVLDRHGVYGLQRNLLVENIIDVYKQEVSNVNNSSSPALPPPAPPPPAEMTCSDHEGEKMNIYCLTCRRPTCSLCKVFGSHQSCNVAPLTHVYEQQKVELNEGLSSLAAFSDRIQALIAELEQSCRNVEEVYKMQKQLVSEKFDRLFSIVDERRKAMMERITSEQEEKTGHAQALVRCYGDTVEANNKLMERAASSMDDPDTAAFVQNSRELITKVTAAAAFYPAETLTPGFENMNHYAFIFSRQEEVLQNIDFPRVEEDVPEEPQPEETYTQDLDLQPPQETSLQSPDPEPGPEPVKELTQTLISSSLEPVEIQEPVHMSPAAPVQMWDSEEPVLDLDSANPDPGSDEGVPGQTEIQRQDTEPRRTQPGPVKEKNICQQQEGMSTLQAVTLLFYLLAFLLILQRVWGYIGCFILT